MDGIIQYEYNCTMQGVTLVYEYKDYDTYYHFEEDITIEFIIDGKETD